MEFKTIGEKTEEHKCSCEQCTGSCSNINLDDISVKYRDIVHELNRYSRAMCLMNDDLLQVSQENAKDLSKMVAREQRDYQEFNQFKIKVQKFIGENT